MALIENRGVAVDSNQAFSVEQNGINIVPDAERSGRPADLFSVWSAANVILTYVIVGSLLVVMGLTPLQMITVVVAGYAVYWLVGYVSIPGARAGTATLAISRGIFGSTGNLLPSLFSWLTNVGWESVNLVLATFALFTLCQQLGFEPSPLVKALLLLGLAVFTFGIGVLGHATILFMQQALTWALGAVMLGLIPQIYWAASAAPLPPVEGADLPTMLIALGLTISMPLSYVNGAANFARYLPKATSGASIAFWTFLGAFIPATTITVIGYFAARVADLTDPIAGLGTLLAPWYFNLYLVLIVGGAITNNFINTYSSGMSLLAMGLRTSRSKAVLLDAALATAASACAIFLYDFTSAFIAFLALMVVWIAPWCAIFVVDTFLRRGRYDDAPLFADDLATGGIPRWKWDAYASWVLGIVAALACTTTDIFRSPFAERYLAGADVSILVGFAVSGIAFWLLRRRQLPS